MASRRITLQMGLSLPLALRWPGSPRAAPIDRLGAKLRRLFRHPADADAVGARLGWAVLPGDRLDEVVALLQQGRGDLPPISPDASSEQLSAALRERARDDFRAGRTLWLDGWLLAETEARLLRIAHLARPH